MTMKPWTPVGYQRSLEVNMELSRIRQLAFPLLQRLRRRKPSGTLPLGARPILVAMSLEERISSRSVMVRSQSTMAPEARTPRAGCKGKMMNKAKEMKVSGLGEIVSMN
jgi:hypothetical protein